MGLVDPYTPFKVVKHAYPVYCNMQHLISPHSNSEPILQVYTIQTYLYII